jgi:hypothetical protein
MVSMDIEMLNNIAQLEFGMDYDQLGSNEQEWCEVEYENFI